MKSYSLTLNKKEKILFEKIRKPTLKQEKQFQMFAKKSSLKKKILLAHNSTRVLEAQGNISAMMSGR